MLTACLSAILALPLSTAKKLVIVVFALGYGYEKHHNN